MSNGRSDDLDGPPDVEPRRTDEEPDAPDAVEAEQEGWVDSVRRDRPVLYAARHLIKPVVQLLVVVLGLGALIRALLPRINVDMEWLNSWGREHLSWVPDPLGWAARWVGDRFSDVQVADWVGTVFRNAKWWVPILVAIGVGFFEVLRRWEAAASTPDDQAPADGDAAAEGDDGVSNADGHADAARDGDDEPGQGDVQEGLS